MQFEQLRRRGFAPHSATRRLLPRGGPRTGGSTYRQKKGCWEKKVLALAVAGMVLVTATAATASQGSKSNRVRVKYVLPKDPAHQHIYERLKQDRALEKLQNFLSPFELPRTLTVSLKGCDGEADAWYDEDEITICYEYINELWKNMPAKTTPLGIEPMDTVIGPLCDTALHEFAHAFQKIFATEASRSLR
jgi:hypothetical protein